MGDLFEGMGDTLSSLGDSIGDMASNLVGGDGLDLGGAGSDTPWTFAPDWQPSSDVPDMFKEFTSNLPNDMLPSTLDSTANSFKQMSDPSQLSSDAVNGMDKSGPATPMDMVNNVRPTLGGPSPQQPGGTPMQGGPMQGGAPQGMLGQGGPMLGQQAPTMGIPSGGIMPKMPAMMGPGGQQMPMPKPPMLGGAPMMPPLASSIIGGQQPSLMSRVGNALMPQQAQAMPSVPQPINPLTSGQGIRQGLQQEAQAAGNIPKGAQQYQATFNQVGKQLGVNPNYFNRLGVETGGRFDPRAVSPTGAKGLFQFTGRTWNGMVSKYPNAFKGVNVDRFDPRANTIATGLLARENAQALQKSLGRAPTNSEVYMAHNIGSYGARKLINADPNTPVNQVIGPKQLGQDVIGTNPTFFRGKGGYVTAGEAIRRYNKHIGTEAFF